jgi:hypothetical protein
MLGQTSLPVVKTSLPLQVDTDQAASSQAGDSQRHTRLVFTGFGFAVLMLIGLSASRHWGFDMFGHVALSFVPLASQASANPSRSAAEVAFSPVMPALGPAGARLSGRARPTGLRPAASAPHMSAPSGEQGGKASGRVEVATLGLG